MALPFRKRGGNGGFLNGVSGVIKSIGFKANKTGKTKKGNTYTQYSGVVLVVPDGGEPVEQYLDAGFLYGDNTVSEDGRTIKGADVYTIDPDTQFGRFIASLVEGEGNRLPEDLLGDCRNYDGVAGTRVTFARQVDEEATFNRGVYKLGAKAKNMDRAAVIEAGKRVDKKDKSKKFMLDNLLVAEVLAGPEPGAKSGAKKAAGSKAAASKPAAEPAAIDTDQADAALAAIVGGAADKTIARDKLSSAVLRYAVANKLSGAERDALRTLLASDEYLDSAVERELIVLDGEGKGQSIVLV